MKISKQKIKYLIESIIKEAIDDEGNFDIDIPEDPDDLKYKVYTKPKPEQAISPKGKKVKGTLVQDPAIIKTDNDPYMFDSEGDGNMPFKSPSSKKETLYIFDFDDCLIDSEGLMIISVLAGVWDGNARVQSGQKEGYPDVKKGGIKNTSFPIRSREYTNLKDNYPELFVWHNFVKKEYPKNGKPYDPNTQSMTITAQSLGKFSKNDYNDAISALAKKYSGYNEYKKYPIVRLSGKSSPLQKSYVSDEFYRTTTGGGGTRKVNQDYFLGKPKSYSVRGGQKINKDNRPINVTLDRFEAAVNDTKGIPAVITARSPRAGTAVPFIIDEFRKGLIHRYDVYGCGIVPSQKKGHIINRLIVKNNNAGHSIKKVVVYEDSLANILEIEQSLKIAHPNVRLEAYHVQGFEKGSNFQKPQDDPTGDVEYKIVQVR